MSLVIIVGTSAPPAGPVTSTLTEVQKSQITNYAVTVLYYEAKAFRPQSLTESQKAQIAHSVLTLGYGTGTGVANAQSLTESQKAQMTYAITNLSYS